MPYELIPTACAAITTCFFALWAVRRSSGAREAVSASLVFFAGLTLAGSMVLHCGEILYDAVKGIEVGLYVRGPNAPQANLFGFRYDFRFYSLELFGAVLMYWGIRLASDAAGMIKKVPEAQRHAWKQVVYVSLFVMPIVPMHIFAAATVVVMCIASIGLVIARKPESATSMETVFAESVS